MIRRAGRASRATERCATVALAVAAIAGAVPACDDKASSSEPPSGQRSDLTVAVVPNVDVAALRLGIDKGFFEDEALDVEIQTTQAAPTSFLR
ncbi:MAG: hypothetical protein ACRD2C_14795 [Acidimicrobiales bacterium]